MKLIFHIGMGKTGTSSIQRTLESNTESLTNQHARFLGMWFSTMDTKFHGPEGMSRFFKLDKSEMAANAERWLAELKKEAERDSISLFVFSNESLFGHGERALDFFEFIKSNCDVEFILYVREPRSWVPSAFTQWGIRHKGQRGSIKSLRELAPTIMKQYDAIHHWHEHHNDVLQVRQYARGMDVVQDFAGAVGLVLEPLQRRVLERGEQAETLLRALFNNRFEGAVLPDRFDSLVVNSRRGPVFEVDKMMQIAFDHGAVGDIIDENRATFEFFEEHYGLDLLTDDETKSDVYDQEAIRSRLLDYVVEIALQQSLKLRKLERQVENLERAIAKPD